MSSLPSHEEMLELAAGLSDHATAVDEFEPALLDAQAHTPSTAACLEIGVLRGGSALLILWHILTEGKGRQFWTVDHGGEASDHMLREIERAWVRISPRHHSVCDQHDWVMRVPPARRLRLGFVYHDGEHGTRSVHHDLTALAPHLVPGAIVAIDDAHQCEDLDVSRLGLSPVDYSIRQHGCTKIAFFRKG